MRKSFLLAVVLLLIGASMASLALAPAPASPASPSTVSAQSGVSGTIGATAGTYGLTNPAALQSHAVININGNSGWTAANGVRYGAGTAGNPYVIENWTITQTGSCNYANAIQIHGNSTVYGIVRNVKVVSTCSSNPGAAINLGTHTYPPNYNADRGDNIVVTRTEVDATNTNGIVASYSTNNDTLSYNFVNMSISSTGPYYGVTCQGGTYYCNITGNYIIASNTQSCSGATCTAQTQGIEMGDFDSPTRHRRGAFVRASYNTAINGTNSGATLDPCDYCTIDHNLFYQNYPGQRVVYKSGVPLVARGITVQGDSSDAGISQYARVHNNYVRNYTNNIGAYSFSAWYWNNSLLNAASYGVYVQTNSTPSTYGQYTDFNVIWNNYVSGSGTGDYFLPVNQYTTAFYLTAAPTTTSFPISFTNQASRTITNISYSWLSTSVNISYTIAAMGSYMPAVTVYYISTGVTSQNLQCAWYSIATSAVTVSVANFTPNNTTFTPTYAAGTAYLSCFFFHPSSYYLTKRLWVTQANVSTTSAGSLIATLTGPFGVVFAAVFQGSIPTTNRVPTLSVGASQSYSFTRNLPNAFSVKYNDSDGDAPTYVKAMVSVTNYTLFQNSSNPNYTTPRGFNYSVPSNTFCPGTFSFFFSTSDGNHSIRTMPSQSFTVANFVPVIQQAPGVDYDIERQQGNFFLAHLSALDVDSPVCQSLTWSISGGATSWLHIGSVNGTIYGLPETAGVYPVVIAVSDGTATTYSNFTYTIDPGGGSSSTNPPCPSGYVLTNGMCVPSQAPPPPFNLGLPSLSLPEIGSVVFAIGLAATGAVVFFFAPFPRKIRMIAAAALGLLALGVFFRVVSL